jgi:hypothetical protein
VGGSARKHVALPSVLTPVLAKHSKSLSSTPLRLVTIGCGETWGPMRNHRNRCKIPPGMIRNGQRCIAAIAVLVAVVTMAAPDSCVDDLFPYSAPTSGISARTSGDGPFGCTLEEDCFCCAHIAPVRNFVLPAIMTLADAEVLPNNGQPFDRVASLTFPSYQPPGVSTAFRS